ncbi:MAG TPA: hypothetical protein VNA11_03560 [Pseudonocardia sp.]|nr:hypothetical protein [Pseudonocardia sp.]
MRELYRHSDIDDRASYRDLDHDDRHHDDNDHGTDGHARPCHLRDGAAGVTAMSSSGESEELAPIRERSLQAWQAVASVVAPLTLVTAVLGYVGWVRNRAIFEYFGVSLSLVGFTPQDYLLRSAPIGFGGVLLLTLACAVLLCVNHGAGWLLNRFDGPPRRRIRVGLALIGAVLVMFALVTATPTVMRAGIPSASGAAVLALGTALLLRFGLSLRGESRLLPPGATALCVAFALLAGFWALTAYAKELGDGAARDLDRNVNALPLVTVYSREPIDLAGSRVQPGRIMDQDDQWSYRYTGARLLLYSNNRWFLIPEQSTDSYRSSVTVLPDTEKVRVEVAAPK